MAEKRILILGAGLAGLSAAWHLQKEGYAPVIFEKEEEPGGLARSRNIAGFIFDCDGHLLHFRHNYTRRLVQGILKGNLKEHERSAWVYSHNKYLPYPFQAHLFGLPANIVRECVVGFLEAAGDGNGGGARIGSSLKEWINSRFGSGIARNFLIPYNKKFWTVPPERITNAWVDGFIPQPSVSQVIKGSLRESSDGLGYNARFFYPEKGGIDCLPRAFSSELKNIRLCSTVKRIDLRKKEITLNSGIKENFDYLVSTLPLPQMLYLIVGLPAQVIAALNKLNWNSIFTLNLGFEGEVFATRHWAYFPQDNLSFFRVGFPSSFSSDAVPRGKSSLYAEVSYSKDKPIARNKIVSRIKSDLRKVGIETGKICAEDIQDIKYGYPIYDKNYQKSRETILRYLSGHNVIGCGRYGSWKYMSMEDAILDGKRAAGELVQR